MTASIVVRVGETSGINPPSGGRYAAMVAPVDGETNLGPSVDLRLVGVWRDENNYVGDGPGSGHSQAASGVPTWGPVALASSRCLVPT